MEIICRIWGELCLTDCTSLCFSPCIYSFFLVTEQMVYNARSENKPVMLHLTDLMIREQMELYPSARKSISDSTFEGEKKIGMYLSILITLEA